MRDMLFGTWGPELIAYGQQNPLRALGFTLTAISLLVTIMFGRFSPSGDGADFSGFGDNDAGGE